jgi:hypothetical protein
MLIRKLHLALWIPPNPNFARAERIIHMKFISAPNNASTDANLLLSLSLSLSHSLSLSLFLCVNKLFLHYPSIATCFDKLSKEMSGIACISCVNSVLIRSPAQGEVMKGNGFFLDKIRLDDSVALPVLLLELRLVRFEHTNFPPTNEK